MVTDGLGQNAALTVPDIAGRRALELRDGVGLHELDMLMVVKNPSPPNSRSATARASSVLPTPLGPTQRNTPMGCAGLPSPALAVRSFSATIEIAWSCPTTRLRRRPPFPGRP